MTDALVTRLETDASGRAVKRVHVERQGQQETYSADVVVVSCGAINSAALLLRSASDKHANGLANGSGQVGRNYMCHLNSVMLALSKCENPTVFQKTLGINDFYSGADDFELPLGHIQTLGKTDKNILRGGAPWFAPGVALDYLARHAIDFWLTTEDIPHPDNRVTVGRDGSIHLAKTYFNTEPHKRLLGKLKDLLGPMGCHTSAIPRWSVLGQQIPIAGIAHNCGTVRFGTDPKTSVLDVDCKAHDLDNLYVVDTSFFPSSSAVNPALTAMANALRVGDHLLERLDVSLEAELAKRVAKPEPQEVVS
jgi:choline dehydrogenase-like flavoprotein